VREQQKLLLDTDFVDEKRHDGSFSEDQLRFENFERRFANFRKQRTRENGE
jgi:hypothetical protein